MHSIASMDRKLINCFFIDPECGPKALKEFIKLFN